MARSSIKRDPKYQRKLDEEHVAKQLKLAYPDMAADYAASQVDAEETEGKTKEILGEHNVPSVLYAAYLDFTRQVSKAKRTHSGNTLKTEVQILFDKWKARRLEETILGEIRFRVFTIEKPPE